MIETRTYSDGTTATGPAPLPMQSPAESLCPHCGSEEWDRITDRNAPGASFNRCSRCEREWGPADIEDIRANLKEAIARGRDPHLSAEQCVALVQLIDADGVMVDVSTKEDEPVQDAASVEGLMEDARVDWLLSPQCKISPKRQLQEAQLIQQVWDAAIRAYAQRLKEGK